MVPTPFEVLKNGHFLTSLIPYIYSVFVDGGFTHINLMILTYTKKRAEFSIVLEYRLFLIRYYRSRSSQ